jgi:3',5'-cyclic AMP phosphodiesterase CpdA
MDKKQIDWLNEKLATDTAEWKIAYFHHPPYSSGGAHGSDTKLREIVEPIFLKHGVDVVFAGHEHFYERIKPQKGITYFVIGSSGQLRRGGITPSNLTAAGFADDQVFALMEVAGSELYFQAVSRTGKIVDSGIIYRRRAS